MSFDKYFINHLGHIVRKLFTNPYINLATKISLLLGILIFAAKVATPEIVSDSFSSNWILKILIVLPITSALAQWLCSRYLIPEIVSIEPPTQNILGPFLCKPAATSMGFWFSFWSNPKSVNIEVYQDQNLIFNMDLICKSEQYFTWIGEAKNLHPNSFYTYKAFIDGAEYSPLWSSDFKFTTMSSDPNENITFFSMSCHGVREWEKSKKTRSTWAMWDKLNEHADSKKFSFGLLGGDQVYMDSQFDDRIRKYDKLPKSHRIELIRQVYFEYWSHASYQKIMCRTPCLLMWDDHDLIDGFGSRLDSFDKSDFKPNWQVYKQELSEAFFFMQAIRNPGTDEMSDNYSYNFDIQQLQLIGLDLRSERNVMNKQMLSEHSREKIKKAIQIRTEKPLFILSPVTVTRISGGVESFLSQLSNTVWRYTRWIGYGPNFTKVLLWQILFWITFVALQLRDTAISNTVSSLMLFIIGVFPLIKSLIFKNSSIESKLRRVAHILFAIMTFLGISGIIWEYSINKTFFIDELPFSIKFFANDESHNLLILFLTIFLSQVLIFDSNAFQESMKKRMKCIGGIISAISFISLLWYGMPDDYIHINMFIKGPLAIMCFAFLVISYLESLRIIDEVAGLDDDIKDSWSSEPNEQELRWLFDIIKNFKREVHLLCGDIHTGGFSNIFLNESNKRISQITNSPMTYPEMPAMVEKFTSGFKKIDLPAKNPIAVAENTFFISERNFGIVTVKDTRNILVEFVFEEHRQNTVISISPPLEYSTYLKTLKAENETISE